MSAPSVGTAQERVVIFGGGVAGMTAAHELIERGFQVTVLEDRARPGGKARSVDAIASTIGQPALPGEHGFRFFPGFYHHLPDTMSRIPYPGNADGVLGNLVACDRFEFCRTDGPAIVLPTHPPTSFDDVILDVAAFRSVDWAVGAGDVAHFLRRVLILLTSCEERQYREWDYVSWWDFCGAAERSVGYQKYLAGGLTRCFVAAKADQMSARTGGYVGLRLEHDALQAGAKIDRVLDGPTDERWIVPWLHHLTALGVDYRFRYRVHSVDTVGQRVTAVVAEGPEGLVRIEADYYISALPVERMTEMAIPELCALEPRLANLKKLVVNWMNGVQFYLRRSDPIVEGHTVFIDSPWALTSISQAQFWRGIDLTKRGDGNVSGILSVDVSDWQTKGTNGKTAMDCNGDEIIEEVWKQLKAHRGRDGAPVLDDDDRVTAFVDRDIEWLGPHDNVNVEPLLVNTVGSWNNRPPAVTAIENLFLASDYVQTYTDLACMEGANEAARRAVNGILAASGSSEHPCEIWPPHESALFAPLRAIDRARLKLGHDHQLLGPGQAPRSR